jgi:hypothetical protein
MHHYHTLCQQSKNHIFHYQQALTLMPCRLPLVTLLTRGSPNASTLTCIFVVNPPRPLPKAWLSWPPFPPAACWWALTMLASIECHSWSPSLFPCLPELQARWEHECLDTSKQVHAVFRQDKFHMKIATRAQDRNFYFWGGSLTAFFTTRFLAEITYIGEYSPHNLQSSALTGSLTFTF